MKAALEYVNGGQMEKDFKSGSRELYVSLEDVYSIPRIGQESQVPIQMLLITTAQVSESRSGEKILCLFMHTLILNSLDMCLMIIPSRSQAPELYYRWYPATLRVTPYFLWELVLALIIMS